MEGALFATFTAFAGGAREMDGRAFAKCMRDAKLLDMSHMKQVDADLIHMKHRRRGSRKIDFESFCSCLGEVATRKGIDMRDAASSVCDAKAPAYESSIGCGAPADGARYGPERFFYDQATYTGTRRLGGPTVLGGGCDDGDVIRDDSLLNRGKPLEDALHRKKAEPLPTLLGGQRGLNSSTSGRSSSRGLGAKGLRRASSQKLDGSASRRAASPKGPERFFYDRQTYTGTHKHGGPSVIGNGLPKEAGYEDLSKLVDRDHVQDDSLHRKKKGSDGMSPRPSGEEQDGSAEHEAEERKQLPMDLTQSAPAAVGQGERGEQADKRAARNVEAQLMGPVASDPTPHTQTLRPTKSVPSLAAFPSMQGQAVSLASPGRQRPQPMQQQQQPQQQMHPMVMRTVGAARVPGHPFAFSPAMRAGPLPVTTVVLQSRTCSRVMAVPGV
mmetsp:Transcript_106223/g.307439  ORF Transcript_106223/g.307439 Transcript_106223/m.307439 type:complete len:441 (+) Transcript_106223:117-1439(+)